MATGGGRAARGHRGSMAGCLICDAPPRYPNLSPFSCAARLDWKSQVEPVIFGALFNVPLDPAQPVGSAALHRL